MKDEQGTRIARKYRHLEIPSIEILHIEDKYKYLNKELIELLTDRINATLKIEYNI